jgi:proteasome accessory factor C
LRTQAPIPPERLSRALSLLAFLLDEERGERVPLTAIEEGLGLTRQEVEEDLEQLNLVNHGGGTYVLYAEIEGDEVVVTREVLAESHARPARLSPLMARALLLALDLVGDVLPGEGRGSLASARDKLQGLVAGLDLPPVEVADLLPADKRVAAVLNRALREREVVRLEYYTPAREELTTRLVEPYLLFHSGSGWYLEAYCLRAEGQRTFRLDLIRSAEGTGRFFAPRAEIDLSSRRAGHVQPGSGALWAVVSFPEARRTVLQEQGYHVSEAPGGRVRARIPYLDGRWLVREILRHAGEAILESPADLRQEVAARAAALIQNYETGGEG